MFQTGLRIRVDNINADPDPAFHFNADPKPNLHLNGDPDPGL